MQNAARACPATTKRNRFPVNCQNQYWHAQETQACIPYTNLRGTGTKDLYPSRVTPAGVDNKL
jgi:hypothetical protein